MFYPTYPTSSVSCKAYADYLTDLKKVKYIPIQLIDDIGASFAAVTEEELESEQYLENGWTVIKPSSIILKHVIVIDGKELEIFTCDYTQSIQENDEFLTNEEIIDYIKEDCTI